MRRQYSIRTMLLLTAVFAVGALSYSYLMPKPRLFESAKKRELKQSGTLPKGRAYWFLDRNENIVSVFLIFGDHPITNFPHIDGGFYVESYRIPVPKDRQVYVISPSLDLVKIDLKPKDIISPSSKYSTWGQGQADSILENKWSWPYDLMEIWKAKIENNTID